MKGMNYSMSNIEKIVFVVAASLLVLAPAFNTNIKSGQVSAMDNRMLAEFPYGTWREQPSLIDSYLNDRIGFREKMITAYQKLDIVLFNVFSHPGYQMGKNGWIYTREWDSVDYQHLDVEDGYIDAFSDFLASIQTYCESRDAEFCFFLAPNKETVYPEYYPDGYGIKAQPNRSDRIVDELNVRGISYVDSRERLIKEKINTPVCNQKYDAGHWNMNGAFAGTQLLYEEFLMKKYPEIGMLEKSEFQIEEREEKYLTGSFIEINEKVPFYISKAADVIDTSEEAFENFNTPGDYHWQWRNTELSDNPKILIFGDSYYGSIGSFFTGHFSEVTLLHITNMYDFYRYMEETDPDIVVIEAVERVIDSDVWPGGYFNWTEKYFDADINGRV